MAYKTVTGTKLFSDDDVKVVTQRCNYNSGCDKWSNLWGDCYPFEVVQEVMNTYYMLVADKIVEPYNPDKNSITIANEIADRSGLLSVQIQKVLYEMYYATIDGKITLPKVIVNSSGEIFDPSLLAPPKENDTNNAGWDWTTTALIGGVVVVVLYYLYGDKL
jgi:hypothetical protein